MKKAVFLCILSLFFIKNNYSQPEGSTENISKSLISIADSLRTKYKFYYKFYSNIEDSISFSKGENYISFGFSPPSSKDSAFDTYRVLDSLAKTEIYTNKVVANKIAAKLVQHYSISRDFSCYHCENIQITAWQKELLINLTISDIKNCMRMMIDNNDAALYYLPSNLYTPEIINSIKYLYINPYLSKKEAKVIAQRERTHYNIQDTVGFSSQNKDYNKLTHNDKIKIRTIKQDLINAKKLNQPLNFYYDSLNKIENTKYVNAWINHLFIGSQQLIEVIAAKKIYHFAQFIDSIYHTQNSKYWNNFSIDDILARLAYNNYPEKQISKYSSNLDSLKNIIENKSLDKNSIKNLEKEILFNYRKLIYINSQESISKTAPLLLIKQRSSIDNDSYIIGAKFFLSLNDNILNFPWNIKEHEKVISGEPIHVVDEWYIENKMPSNFLEKIYEWMINNKGNYEINEN